MLPSLQGPPCVPGPTPSCDLLVLSSHFRKDPSHIILAHASPVGVHVCRHTTRRTHTQTQNFLYEAVTHRAPSTHIYSK